MLIPLHHKETRGWQMTAKWVYIIINGVCIAANLADSVYFKYTMRRTTNTIFSEFSNEGNIGSIIGVEFLRHWYLVLLFIIIMWGIWKFYFMGNSKRSARTSSKPRGKQLVGYYVVQTVCFGLFIPLCICGMRGGATTAVRPITISNANQYIAHPQEAGIVLNTPFSLIRTIGKKAFEIPNYMTEEEMNALYSPVIIPNFSPSLNNSSSFSHGFGLLNCRGIIEQYKKTSQRFSVCLLSAESEKGRGSRFFFRLPKGVMRLIMALLSMSAFIPSMASRVQEESLRKAAAFADSAYYSNIAGTYERTLHYADSCRIYLNEHYLTVCPGGKYLMQRQGNSAQMPPEVRWLRDSVNTNYDVILDIRNESAVACLALHRWQEYTYNNEVYTRLFKELSADASLPAYCKKMRKQQSDKNVAIVLLVILLLSILPAYYLLYYRHRLYYRFCVDKVKDINRILVSDTTSADKLAAIERLTTTAEYPEQLTDIVNQITKALVDDISQQERQTTDVETAADELQKAEYECNQLYISNSIVDNCLSTLKHETMYYPSRIRQLVASTDDLLQIRDLVAYYRDIYTILSQQAMRQFDHLHTPIAAVGLDRWFSSPSPLPKVLANVQLLSFLVQLLRKQNNGDMPSLGSTIVEGEYVSITLTMSSLPKIDPSGGDLFSPSTVDNIPFLVIRQIVRDISELTKRRGCGVKSEGKDIIIRLPHYK